MAPKPQPRRRSCGLALLVLYLSGCAALLAQPTEYEVKAAFLLNFTKFVDWPASVPANPDSPLVICILGKDPLGRALDGILEGEDVNGRKVVARRISTIPEPQACQVVFFGEGEKEVRKTVSGLGRGVLTVGDGESFIRDGGMIAFVIENRRVRFSINQSAAEAAGLKLSSRLLSVAKSVEK